MWNHNNIIWIYCSYLQLDIRNRLISVPGDHWPLRVQSFLFLALPRWCQGQKRPKPEFRGVRSYDRSLCRFKARNRARKCQKCTRTHKEGMHRIHLCLVFTCIYCICLGNPSAEREIIDRYTKGYWKTETAEFGTGETWQLLHTQQVRDALRQFWWFLWYNMICWDHWISQWFLDGQ